MAKANLMMIAAMDTADLKKLSERDFQRALFDYAESQDWKVHYIYKSAQRLKDGSYRGMGTAGWPDLFMARTSDRRLIALELKSMKGKATPAQEEWLQIMAICGVETDVVRPSDAADLIERLK